MPTYNEYQVSPNIRIDLAALGPLGTVVQSIIEKSADDLNNAQYIVSATTSNLNAYFLNACDNTKKQADQFSNTVAMALVDPQYQLTVNTQDILQQAAALRFHMQNIDVPVAAVLKDALQGQTACISSLAKSLAASVLTNTAAVAKVPQIINFFNQPPGIMNLIVYSINYVNSSFEIKQYFSEN